MRKFEQLLYRKENRSKNKLNDGQVYDCLYWCL